MGLSFALRRGAGIARNHPSQGDFSLLRLGFEKASKVGLSEEGRWGRTSRLGGFRFFVAGVICPDRDAKNRFFVRKKDVGDMGRLPRSLAVHWRAKQLRRRA